jgi:hypothetical protein
MSRGARILPPKRAGENKAETSATIATTGQITENLLPLILNIQVKRYDAGSIPRQKMV